MTTRELGTRLEPIVVTLRVELSPQREVVTLEEKLRRQDGPGLVMALLNLDRDGRLDLSDSDPDDICDLYTALGLIIEKERAPFEGLRGGEENPQPLESAPASPAPASRAPAALAPIESAPAASKSRPVRWTDQRKAFVKTGMANGASAADMLVKVNSLPGEPVSDRQLKDMIKYWGASAKPAPAVVIAQSAAAAPPVAAPAVVAKRAPESGFTTAPYAVIKQWAAKNGIAFDGGNMDRVNKVRGQLGMKPFVCIGSTVPGAVPAA